MIGNKVEKSNRGNIRRWKMITWIFFKRDTASRGNLICGKSHIFCLQILYWSIKNGASNKHCNSLIIKAEREGLPAVIPLGGASKQYPWAARPIGIPKAYGPTGPTPLEIQLLISSKSWVLHCGEGGIRTRGPARRDTWSKIRLFHGIKGQIYRQLYYFVIQIGHKKIHKFNPGWIDMIIIT